MATRRRTLPHRSDRLYMTDGGLETTLLFHDGIDLPAFAAFDLLRTREGTQRLHDYYRLYAALAAEHALGMVLEAPTWRANADWGAKLGYDAAALERINRRAIGLLAELREQCESADSPMVLSGCLGPRGDGYRPAQRMSAEQARVYHATQIDTFADTRADMVAAFTMNYVEEALGIALAARDAAMPVAISFTLEVDGRLPSGEALPDAIERTDAHSGGYPAYYMINCAYPTHFAHVLESGSSATGWRARIRGLRANASARSHAELDESTELDDGDPAELGRQYAQLRAALPQLAVVGGCCGTDHRHVHAICSALARAELRQGA